VRSYAFGVIGLRPAEYYAMTEAEYSTTVDGYQLKQGIEDASIRRLAMVVANSAGAKIKSEQSLWRIPAIDGDATVDFKRNIELLKAKAKQMEERKNKAG